MKLGFILECGPIGADLKVCKYLVNRVRPNDQVIVATLDNKPKLVTGCGEAAKQLLISGCSEIFIIWDLFPGWRTAKTKPCRKEDRDNIFESLKAAEVKIELVSLVCIEQELESWLIADGRAISTFLSTPTRKIKVADAKYPDRLKNPKKKLNTIFTRARGENFNYIDHVHAEKLVALIPDFQRLKRSETFKRFYHKLTGNALI